jgi:hypothetical protein
MHGGREESVAGMTQLAIPVTIPAIVPVISLHCMGSWTLHGPTSPPRDLQNICLVGDVISPDASADYLVFNLYVEECGVVALPVVGSLYCYFGGGKQVRLLVSRSTCRHVGRSEELNSCIISCHSSRGHTLA